MWTDDDYMDGVSDPLCEQWFFLLLLLCLLLIRGVMIIRLVCVGIKSVIGLKM